MQKLYIIRSGKTQLFKIGISKSPEKRLKQLQTGNPSILKIYFVFTISNKYQYIEAIKVENTIHKYLKECSGKHIINEWFNLTDDEVIKIAKCLISNFS